MTIKYSGKTRVESDLLGEMEVPVEALYGVQTLRGIVNFPISRFHLNDYPLFINGLAMTKLGAAVANHQLGLLTDEQFNAIKRTKKEQRCKVIAEKEGVKLNPDFMFDVQVKPWDGNVTVNEII